MQTLPDFVVSLAVGGVAFVFAVVMVAAGNEGRRW